jgi:cytosine deaminase
MGYEQIHDSSKLMSSHCARTLNVQDRYDIEVGKPANVLILFAENGFDAVRRQLLVRYSIRHGRVIAETRPAQTQHFVVSLVYTLPQHPI